MERITHSNLQGLVDRINKATGSPLTTYQQHNGHVSANVGNYHLDHNIGGWSLERISNDGGGVTTAIERCSARELWERMRAFLAGISAVKGKWV